MLQIANHRQSKVMVLYVIGFMTFYIACRPDHIKVIQQTTAVHLLGAAGKSRTS